jgi:hypothetical protein
MTPTEEDEFKDDNTDFNPPQRMTPTKEDEFKDDNNDFIELFLRPCGQQLDDDDCRVAEDDDFIEFFFALAGSNLPKMTVVWEKTTTLLNFFFALAGSSLIKTIVVWQNKSTDEKSIAGHHKPMTSYLFPSTNPMCTGCWLWCHFKNAAFVFTIRKKETGAVDLIRSI